MSGTEHEHLFCQANHPIAFRAEHILPVISQFESSEGIGG